LAEIFSWTVALSRPETRLTYLYDFCVKSSLQSKKKAQITRECSLHTLRHSFATHLLYNGYDLYTISQLLGHASIETTTIYLHIVPARFAELKSPLDFLELEKEDNNEKK
jgi:site-specific recombinase XerD